MSLYHNSKHKLRNVYRTIDALLDGDFPISSGRNALRKLRDIFEEQERKLGVRQFISWRPQTLRETTSPRNDYISQNQSIHFCPEETIQGFLWLADYGLILIERCVEYHGYASENAKAFDQAVISRVG
jgi:hypothetical protein